MTRIPASIEEWVAELRERAHADRNALSRIEGLITGIVLRLDREESTSIEHANRLTALEKFRYAASGAIAVLVFALPITVGVFLAVQRHQ